MVGQGRLDKAGWMLLERYWERLCTECVVRNIRTGKT